MVEYKTWKNKTILVITDDQKKYKRISFGFAKATLILQNLEAIKEFVSQEIMKATIIKGSQCPR